MTGWITFCICVCVCSYYHTLILHPMVPHKITSVLCLGKMNNQDNKASMSVSPISEKPPSKVVAMTTTYPTEDEGTRSYDTDANSRHSVCESKPTCLSSTKRMEKITRREALHHTDMAWSAQQRLMQRCLRLRFVHDDQEEQRVIETAGSSLVADGARHGQK